MKNIYFIILMLVFSATAFAQGIAYDSVSLHFNDTDTEINEIEYGQTVIVQIHGVRDYDLVDGDYRLNIRFNVKSLDGDILYERSVSDENFFFDSATGLMQVKNILYTPLTPGKYYDVEVVAVDRYSNEKIEPRARIMLLEPFIGKNVKSLKSEGLEWAYPKLYRNGKPYADEVFYKDEEIKLELMFNQLKVPGKEFVYDVKIYDKKEVIMEYNDIRVIEEGLNYFDFSIDISSRKELVAGGKYTLDLGFKASDGTIVTQTTAKFNVIADPGFDDKPSGKMKYEQVILLMDMDTVKSEELVEGKELRIYFDDITGMKISNGMLGIRFYIRILDTKGNVVFSPGEKIDVVRNVLGDGTNGDAWIYFTIPPHLERRDNYIIEVLCADKNSGRFIMLKQPVKIADYFKHEGVTIVKQTGFEVNMVSVSQDDKMTDKKTYFAGEKFDVNVYYKLIKETSEDQVFLYSIDMFDASGEQLLDFKTETDTPKDEFDSIISKISTGSDFTTGKYSVVSKLKSVSGSHEIEVKYEFNIH